MGYRHIENLYKNPEMLDVFKNVWALEKIHGTSAHVSYKAGRVALFAGGSSHSEFIKLFDEAELKARFEEIVGDRDTSVHVYGEAYGGKMQGMRTTYGDTLRFVAFEVKIGDKWLNVPKAEAIAHKLGLDFVFYRKIPCTIEALDEERLLPSVQAEKNGIENPEKLREGIVIRPLEELTQNNDTRIMAKHKNPEYSERKSGRDTVLKPEKAYRLKTAAAVAEEWVTRMRLDHVLDALGGIDAGRENLGRIIPAMQEDVTREAGDEIEWTKETSKAIGHAVVELVKERERAAVTAILNDAIAKEKEEGA